MWQNLKTQIVMELKELKLWGILKLKLWWNLKTQIVTTQKLKLWWNLKTQNVTKLKMWQKLNANYDITYKLKLCQKLKLWWNSNEIHKPKTQHVTKFKWWQNLRTQLKTKRKESKFSQFKNSNGAKVWNMTNFNLWRRKKTF